MKTISKRLPRTVAGAKEYAKYLRQIQAQNNSTITHSKALELTAQALGFANWNIAVNRLHQRPKFEPEIGQVVEGTYLKQAFKGKIRAVKSLAQGSLFQVSIHFDTPVDVVQFNSFSAFRQRVNVRLDHEGVCVRSTSDGEPHMIIENTISNVV